MDIIETPTEIEGAKQRLKDIQEFGRRLSEQYRPPLLLTVFMGACQASIAMGYGMTEHENDWALAMVIGGIGSILGLLLYIYTFRLLGIKLAMIPRDRRSRRYGLGVMTASIVLIFGGRKLRLLGLAYAPHACAALLFVAAVYSMHRYPTGTVPAIEAKND